MSEDWDRTVDVIVAGTGAAGMTAAIVAHDGGCAVELLEKADLVGGTTAFSGGMPWVPLNAHLRDVGVEDTREEAIEYIDGLTQGRGAPAEVIETYVDRSSEAIAYLEEHTPLKYKATEWPDYHADRRGGKLKGRSLDAQPFDLETELGEWRGRLRQSPYMPTRLTLNELAGPKWGGQPAVREDGGTVDEVMADREEAGIRTMGESLAGSLLRGVLDREIPISLNTRVKRLVVEDDTVVGVVAVQDGHEVRIGARRGVVLATGGFEWNQELVRAFLNVVDVMPLSPSTNEGDGLEMGLKVGAAVSNMTSVVPAPVTYDGTSTIDGQRMPSAATPRFEPGCIMVNRQGRRFVNEALSYMEVSKAMRTYDPLTQTYPNQSPTWMVFDADIRGRVTIGDMTPGAPTPGWVKEALTIEDLARQMDIDPAALADEIRTFNGYAATGKDLDHGRGTQSYELGLPDARPGEGVDRSMPEAYLAPVQTAPFYAMPLHDGILGTVGGLTIDKDARVQALTGGVIAGLYAAGNVAGGIFGPAYPGGGSTLGPAMTFGYLAGRHLSSEVPSKAA